MQLYLQVRQQEVAPVQLGHSANGRWLPRWVSAVAAAAVIAGSVASAAAQTGSDVGRDTWEPERTRVFIVDVMLYKGEKEAAIASWLEIPSSALIDQFRQLGVPAGQITLVKDARATAGNVKEELAACLGRSRPGEMLIFYFSGHGGVGTLSMHDKSVPQSWLVDAIEAGYKGDRVMLFIDCCQSGGVVELVAKRKSKIAYAALSSTFSQQSAWSGCRFLQCLLRGFGGNPVVDLDRDGVVMFGELARYTERYMAFAAEGKPMYVTTGGFDPKLRLTKAKGKAQNRVGELVQVRSSNKWWSAEVLAVSPPWVAIHYTENTKPTNDKVVPAADIRPVQFQRFKVGQRVEVESGTNDKWHKAKVLDTFANLHLCHCDDLPSSNDEWFGPSRIRPAR